MKVQHTINLGGGHSIELGDATWDLTARSIRDRYETASGGFSPHSSSEVPMEDLGSMIAFAAEHDELSAAECAKMIIELAASIKRQHP